MSTDGLGKGVFRGLVKSYLQIITNLESAASGTTPTGLEPHCMRFSHGIVELSECPFREFYLLLMASEGSGP